jgi:hypothetical protein
MILWAQIMFNISVLCWIYQQDKLNKFNGKQQLELLSIISLVLGRIGGIAGVEKKGDKK